MNATTLNPPQCNECKDSKHVGLLCHWSKYGEYCHKNVETINKDLKKEKKKKREKKARMTSGFTPHLYVETLNCCVPMSRLLAVKYIVLGLFR